MLDFYKKALVRPDFLPTLEKWEAQVRAGGTPANIFADPEYLDGQFAEYRETVVKAEQFTAESQAAASNSDAYVITTILLAVALFFAGVTSSFKWFPARVLLLTLAVATVAFAAARLADLPVT